MRNLGWLGLSLIATNALAGAPIECPPGTTLRHEGSPGSTEWFICEKAGGVREGPMASGSGGRVSFRTGYHDGLQEGETIHYGLQGQPVVIEHYRAGKLHGLQTMFFPDGKRWTEKEWVDGQLSGHLRKWRPDGTLAVESQWLHGEPQQWTTYFPNGRPHRRADGPPPTLLRDWNDQGTLVKSEHLEFCRVGAIDAGFDEVRLSCPTAKFPKNRELGVSYSQDECGGYPETDAKTGQTTTWATVPRAAAGELRARQCEVEVVRTGEERSCQLTNESLRSYLHSEAEVGDD